MVDYMARPAFGEEEEISVDEVRWEYGRITVISDIAIMAKNDLSGMQLCVPNIECLNRGCCYECYSRKLMIYQRKNNVSRQVF